MSKHRIFQTSHLVLAFSLFVGLFGSGSSVLSDTKESELRALEGKLLSAFKPNAAAGSAREWTGMFSSGTQQARRYESGTEVRVRVERFGNRGVAFRMGTEFWEAGAKPGYRSIFDISPFSDDDLSEAVKKAAKQEPFEHRDLSLGSGLPAASSSKVYRVQLIPSKKHPRFSPDFPRFVTVIIDATTFTVRSFSVLTGSWQRSRGAKPEIYAYGSGRSGGHALELPREAKLTPRTPTFFPVIGQNNGANPCRVLVRQTARPSAVK